MYKITDQLNSKPSKINTLAICNYIIANTNELNNLYTLIFSGEEKIKWKAAWVFEHIFMEKPELVNSYLSDLVYRFPDIKESGVIRHIAKILSMSDIISLANGRIIDVCFNHLISEAIPVAVKSHCISILFNFTKEFPDLKRELILILEEQIPNNSVGFKSKARKIIKKLNS